MRKQLSELRTSLVNCGYPEQIISKAFHYAVIQIPAPYKNKENNLAFFTTYYSNTDDKLLLTNINRKVNNSNSAYLAEVLKD